jgi:hypothetical protein
MSDDLQYLRQECEQLRQNCEDFQRQLNALTAQASWLAEKLGQKASDAALQAGRQQRRRD